MKQGTFNKIFKIGNFIVKLSKEHSSVSSEIAKMGSDDIKKYEKDISSVGINTSKVYLHLKSKNKSLILQEYIDGYTLQEYFESLEISNLDKLKMFRELIILYSKTLQNDNLCLDWNLKNFIISKGDIYYIDYVPALYKDRIMKLNSERLEQYMLSYLDRKIQLAGIMSYAIVPFFKEEKEELKNLFLGMIKSIEEILNIKFNDKDLTNHIYIKKMNILFNYLNSKQDYESFIEQYKSITMEETTVKKRKL